MRMPRSSSLLASVKSFECNQGMTPFRKGQEPPGEAGIILYCVALCRTWGAKAITLHTIFLDVGRTCYTDVTLDPSKIRT
eukprot:1157471-Pelagomonas_calceolata.AAC.1